MNNEKFCRNILSCFHPSGAIDDDLLLFDLQDLKDEDYQLKITGKVLEYVDEYKKGKSGEYGNDN